MTNETFRMFTSLAEDMELIFRFFAFFSRFEYALKRATFLKKKKKAEPDWDKYANTLKGQLVKVNDKRCRSAYTYLKNAPPQQQVVIGSQLTWEDSTQGHGEFEERYILRLVATVRNNLFHGGKYPYPIGPIPDVARNRKLLNASIVILEQCLILSPDVSVYSCENCHLFLLKVYQLSIIHFLLFYFKQSGNFVSINFIVSPIK
jgi:hypothetical protein